MTANVARRPFALSLSKGARALDDGARPGGASSLDQLGMIVGPARTGEGVVLPPAQHEQGLVEDSQRQSQAAARAFVEEGVAVCRLASSTASWAQNSVTSSP